jgi:predicted DNA-binding transcriptional regulator YafY
MKIERLLGITMYLINRDVVTSKELCEKFEVSQRTIVRDIETLNLAGIPVSSAPGHGGGYEILDTFKLRKPIANRDDYRLIIAALKGLSSAVDDRGLDETLEKLMAADNPAQPPKFIIDFGIVKEDERINGLMKIIENAISSGKTLQFDYTKADGGANLRTVEPLALNYKWYAWYLFAYCTYKKDYRSFKLKRMYRVRETGRCFENRHGDVNALLQKSEQNDVRRGFPYTLKCRKDALVLALEYLGGDVIEEYENGDALLSLHGMDGDRLWFSFLLGFGDAVEVVEPEHLRRRVSETAERIFNLYKH